MDGVTTKENIYRGKIVEGARRGQARAGGQAEEARTAAEQVVGRRAIGVDAGEGAAEGAEDVRGKARVGVGVVVSGTAQAAGVLVGGDG